MKEKYIERNQLVNGLICSEVGSPLWDDIIITHNSKDMQLAMDNSEYINESWALMCDSVYKRLGIEIIGKLNINYIVVNGLAKVFH